MSRKHLGGNTNIIIWLERNIYLITYLEEYNEFGWNKMLGERKAGFKEKQKEPFLKKTKQSLRKVGWYTQKERLLKYAMEGKDIKLHHLRINEVFDYLKSMS